MERLRIKHGLPRVAVVIPKITNKYLKERKKNGMKGKESIIEEEEDECEIEKVDWNDVELLREEKVEEKVEKKTEERRDNDNKRKQKEGEGTNRKETEGERVDTNQAGVSPIMTQEKSEEEKEKERERELAVQKYNEWRKQDKETLSVLKSEESNFKFIVDQFKEMLYNAEREKSEY